MKHWLPTFTSAIVVGLTWLSLGALAPERAHAQIDFFTNFGGGLPSGWTLGDDQLVTSSRSCRGSSLVQIASGSGAPAGTLTTGTFAGASAQELQVSFVYRFDALTSSAANPQPATGTFGVDLEYSTDGGSSWQAFGSVTDASGSHPTCATATFLTPTLASGASVRLRWTFRAPSPDYFGLIDDIRLLQGNPIDDCAGATTVTIGAEGTCTSFTPDFDEATESPDKPSCAGRFDTSPDVWYSFEAPATGGVRATVSVPSGTPTTNYNLTVYSTCGGSEVACLRVDTDGGEVGEIPGLTPGNDYLLRIGLDGSTAAAICLAAYTPPPPAPNDECADATAVAIAAQGACVPFSPDFAGATQSAAEPSCTGAVNLTPDIWYSFVAPTSGVIRATISVPSRGDFARYGLTAYPSCGGSEVGCFTIDNYEGASDEIEGLSPGATYLLRVTDLGDDVGALCLESYTPPRPPANDDCADATPLTLGAPGTCAATLGTTAGATGSGISPGCAAYGGGDVWFSVVVPASGNLVVETLEGDITDGGLAAYDACGGTLIDCNDDNDDNTMSTLSLTSLTPGATVYLVVYAYDGDEEGSFSICASEPAAAPSNDDCASPLALTNAGGFPTAANGNDFVSAGGTSSGLTGGCSGGEADDDVWFEITVPEGATPTITVQGDDGFDAVIGIYTGACGALTSVACVDEDGDNGGTETYTFGSEGGNLDDGSKDRLRGAPSTYLVQVYDAGSGGSGFAITSGAPVPVELMSFAAVAKTDHNAVTWATATERDLARYVVERATDGVSFADLATVVPATPNSAFAKTYGVTDAHPAALSYYRLRIEDLDGSVAYSEVAAIAREDGAATPPTLTLAPNPASGHVEVSFGASAGEEGAEGTLVLVDAVGRVVLERTVASGTELLRLDLGGLPTGSYTLTVADRRATRSQRLIVR